MGLTGLAFAGTALAEPGLSISPSIGLQQTYTDNTAGLQKSQPDLVTEISPGLSIVGETARAKVNFNYQPTFNHFDLGNSADRIDQNLNGDGTLTPADQLTIDFRAFANEAGASGNSSNQAGVLVPSDNRVLYFIGTASPHYQGRYRDIATVDVYYSVNSTNTSVDGKPILGQQGISSTNSLGQNAELAIGSSESFGRLGLKLDFTHSANSGSGSNTESTTDVDILGVNYHLNRVYALSGSVGYQAINYPASGLTLPYHSEGLTWTVGASITPNELSSIAIGYGKQQGSYNPSVQAGYALGPRTNLTASYVVTVQNQLTATLQNLRYLKYDLFGNAIDSRTGLPFSAVNQTFGSQNVLFRDKPAMMSISHQMERSNLTLTAQYEVRSSLSGPMTSNEVWGATINYSRELTPLLQGNVSVGYTENTSSGLGSLTDQAENISVSAALFYKLSDSATISVIENYFSSSSRLPINSSKTQQLTVGLRKSF